MSMICLDYTDIGHKQKWVRHFSAQDFVH